MNALQFSVHFGKFRAIYRHFNLSNYISFVSVYVLSTFEFTELRLENVTQDFS